MKKTILISSLVLNAALIIFVATSFASKSKNTVKQETKNDPGDGMAEETLHSHYMSRTANEVSINVAIDDLKRFSEKHDYLRAYKISAMDMLEVMGIDSSVAPVPKYQFCRAYLGLDANGKFRLYLTPVAADTDLFYNPDSAHAVRAQSNSYVLDLIAPCPNTCDVTSPLYTFVKP
ncbi:hypothetical protein [Fluviicola sp.]|uniref:hypothetical protein n=1 Tax=Fluviicola sp. TaxID=1917219 RepID=UPI00283A201D|nr:hypothetical protein [Fluviicola sp.]MDR0801710.1 hypothetical protein [Fluviicola sp.]